MFMGDMLGKITDQRALTILPLKQSLRCQKWTEATFLELWNLIKKKKKLRATKGGLMKKEVARFW